MTDFQERQILELKQKGMGFRKIGAATGLNPEMVKSYLRRKKLTEEVILCKYCGKRVVQAPHRKIKKFCDSQCRASWWRDHPEEISRKQYTHICKWCEKSFITTKQTSQYCSKKCYANARRKEDHVNVP